VIGEGGCWKTPVGELPAIKVVRHCAVLVVTERLVSLRLIAGETENKHFSDSSVLQTFREKEARNLCPPIGKADQGPFLSSAPFYSPLIVHFSSSRTLPRNPRHRPSAA